ncbi:endo alpha-1,4 polygalactosaminidase [Brevundimonas sp.]|uniref:endo alpha-1,4 polygalactosaminidase n=1 Tax=Brevundimonas sp. TaxID=1871086 RepID=UPI003BAD671B
MRAIATLLIALMAGSASADTRASDVEQRWVAASSGAVDYQLGGAYPPPPGVTIVVRDRKAAPAPGVFSICYVNGFQTQPGEAGEWLERHPDLILRDPQGKPVADPNWPDEMLLDTRTEARRLAIADIVGSWIDGCADAGFDAVEFDNLDTWARAEGLTLRDNLALAEQLVQRAHGRGLWAAQKNALELGQSAIDAGFDFVISEECLVWRECEGYRRLYGDRHIDVEYIDDLELEGFLAGCGAALPHLSVFRDRGLASPGSAAYTRAVCPT